MELPAGTSTALIGPNGSGKTTLLHVLAGLVTPTAGFCDQAGGGGLHATPDGSAVLDAVDGGRGRQDGPLPLPGAVAPPRVCRSPQRAPSRRSDWEVDNLLGRQFGELSTGQRQRVLFAQAITQEAGLLLLDEPITGLDMASQTRILEVIDDERARGVIVVLSTHHLDEARHCDHVVLMGQPPRGAGHARGDSHHRDPADLLRGAIGAHRRGLRAPGRAAGGGWTSTATAMVTAANTTTASTSTPTTERRGAPPPQAQAAQWPKGVHLVALDAEAVPSSRPGAERR